MKPLLYILFTLLGMSSCQSRQHKTEIISTIDSTLQTNVTSILENKLSEINAQSGQAIIMEVQTGQIKALVGLERKDSADYQPSENFHVQQPTSLMHPISLLAALETGKVELGDMVDVGNGIYHVDGEELKDHNWHRGGYGEISVKQGLAYSSNIATYKVMEAAFGNHTQDYFNLLNKMSYGKPNSITGIANLKSYSVEDGNTTWFCIGYDQLITPIQILTFYNAIANNGKMVQPQLYKDSITVINPLIASQTSIDKLKQALLFNVTDGLGKTVKSNKVSVAGMQGTIVINEEEAEYGVEFCGYFPVDNPKYTMIVSINKRGLPASGGLMAGDVFRQIIEAY